jgi:hypothetical protein
MDTGAESVNSRNTRSAMKKKSNVSRALSLFTSQVYSGMFKCGAQAFRAHKRAKLELDKALTSNCSDTVFANLTAIEDTCLMNLRRLTEWCMTARKSMDMLQARYEEELEAAKALDIEIEKLQKEKGASVPVKDTRTSDVQAFWDFMSTV